MGIYASTHEQVHHHPQQHDQHAAGDDDAHAQHATGDAVASALASYYST